RLATDEADIVVEVPPDPLATLESGKQAQLTIVTDITDPVLANYTSFMAGTLSAAVNREIYRSAAEQGEKYAVSIGGHDLSKVPPEVVASPATPVVQHLAAAPPSLAGLHGLSGLAGHDHARDRAPAGRLARAGAADLGDLGLRAAGGPAGAADAPGVDVLQRLRAPHRGVPARGPGRGVPAAGNPRHLAPAGRVPE